MKIDIGSLNTEDKEFVTALLTKYPHWKKHLTIKNIDGDSVPFIEIQSPASGEKRALSFWSDSANGPSVSFGDWHDHLDLLLDGEVEEKYSELFRIVDAILADELILFWDLASENPYPSLIEPKVDLSLQDRKKVKIMSWSGEMDT